MCGYFCGTHAHPYTRGGSTCWTFLSSAVFAKSRWASTVVAPLLQMRGFLTEDRFRPPARARLVADLSLGRYRPGCRHSSSLSKQKNHLSAELAKSISRVQRSVLILYRNKYEWNWHDAQSLARKWNCSQEWSCASNLIIRTPFSNGYPCGLHPECAATTYSLLLDRLRKFRCNFNLDCLTKYKSVTESHFRVFFN